MAARAVMLGILAAQVLLPGEQSVSPAAQHTAAPIPTSRELWAGYDPRAEPLEIEIAKSWDEGNIHFDQLYFTGETWQATKVRVFAYLAAPKSGKKLPGVLHIHGGGQTASLGWARFWSGRGYVAVSHDLGIHLSTRLIKVSAKDLPGVKPSLERTALIDPMDDSNAWFWWLAGTDPYNQAQLLMPWDGPHGAKGFTHAAPGGFSFATNAVGDPQFKREGKESLLVDVWALAPPSALVVGVATTFFQPGQVNYTAKPILGEPKAGWWTLRLPPGDFKDEKGAALGSWKNVDFLYFQGQSSGQTKTVFKYLRWE